MFTLHAFRSGARGKLLYREEEKEGAVLLKQTELMKSVLQSKKKKRWKPCWTKLFLSCSLESEIEKIPARCVFFLCVQVCPPPVTEPQARKWAFLSLRGAELTEHEANHKAPNCLLIPAGSVANHYTSSSHLFSTFYSLYPPPLSPHLPHP